MKNVALGAIAAATLALTAGAASADLYQNAGDISAYVNDWAIGSQYENFAFLASDNSFVGSWTVDQGPSWTVVPTAYSGLTAAALLFGGSASDYFISTVDNTAANIDHMAWVSTWGGACDGEFPCGTRVAEDAVHGTGGGIPEPATWGLMISGFGLVGATLRRRRTTVALAA